MQRIVTERFRSCHHVTLGGVPEEEPTPRHHNTIELVPVPFLQWSFDFSADAALGGDGQAQRGHAINTRRHARAFGLGMAPGVRLGRVSQEERTSKWSNKNPFILASGLIFLAVSSPGCTTIAKRALNEFRGARSKIIEVPGTVSERIDDFHAVDIRNIQSDLSTLVPRAFADALPLALQSFLIDAETAPFPGEGPSLTVAPSICWYHEPGGLGGLLGSDAYAVVMFYLSDGDDELGKVQVVTRNASSRIGEREMAESMAQELAEWFNDRRPGAVEEHD